MQDSKNNLIEIRNAFGAIKELQQYLPNIKDVVVTADVNQIKTAEFIKKLLSAESDTEIESLFYRATDFTKDLIDYTWGYRPAFRIDKLTLIVQNMAKAQKSQKNESFRKTVKQYEQLVLEMDAEKRDLQRTINKLLELQRIILNDAESKARLTAVDSKKRYRNASETIKTLLGRIYNDETDEYGKVDVDKLKRVYWGKKESYFNG
ncbi:MAG: hypothetical protein IJR92_00140 [Alphaproteobacteria bacterium]|nr:hypothetical protein [Alphaproteobacteria bacterium]